MELEISSYDEPFLYYANRRDYSPDWFDFYHPKNSPPPLKRRNTHNDQNKTLDRITTLSDSTLLHILSFLPTKDAVKTGALSKRWQFLWTSLPNLHFHDPKLYRSNIHRFLTFIDQTLILHKPSKINKFRLDFDYETVFAPRINLFIRFALKKEVQELDLDFLGSRVIEELYCKALPYKLPLHLCTNSSITKLTLRYCRFGSRNRVINWKSLTNLSLAYIQLSDDLIKDILSGSPSLEVLELRECSEFNRLDITSMGLKRLAIYGYGDFSNSDSDLEILAPKLRSLGIFGSFHRKCRLMNLSSLVDATLSFRLLNECGEKQNFYKGYRNFLKDILESLRDVKDLTIGTWCIQVLSIREVIGMFSPLSKRKCLILDTCFNKWDLPGITSLLRSSPILEKLVVNMNSSSTSQLCFDDKFIDSYNFDGENYWTSRVFRCLFGHLKTVKIAGFTAGHLEIELVQFMLKNALVLEKMIICTQRVGHLKRMKHFDPEELLEVARKMLCFPRASPNAVILFS